MVYCLSLSSTSQLPGYFGQWTHAPLSISATLSGNVHRRRANPQSLGVCVLLGELHKKWRDEPWGTVHCRQHFLLPFVVTLYQLGIHFLTTRIKQHWEGLASLVIIHLPWEFGREWDGGINASQPPITGHQLLTQQSFLWLDRYCIPTPGGLSCCWDDEISSDCLTHCRGTNKSRI